MTARVHSGEKLDPFTVESVNGASQPIPERDRSIHLQFRRFAGCPVCTLHLRSFIRRNAELTAHGVREVVVFPSSRDALLKYHAEVPFALVADPRRTLYRRFGVSPGMASLLHPAAWPAVIKGAWTAGFGLPEQTLAAFGLPADFLIRSDGTVAACKYGQHADDQWSVDEVLALAPPVPPARGNQS